MANKGRRKCVSMRDDEYIALKLYKDHIVKEQGGIHTVTSVLKMVLFGELPPIPQEYLELGRREAKIVRDERAKNPAPPTKEKEEQEFRVGGGIFTF